MWNTLNRVHFHQLHLKKKLSNGREIMKYCSTRGGIALVSFEEALFSGILPDGGLYVPVSLPEISSHTLQSWCGLSYQRVATELLKHFISEDEISHRQLHAIVEGACAKFDTSTPVTLHQLESNVYVGELFRGPTMTMKDLALGIIGQLLSHFSQNRHHAVALVGTSGDTGSAAIEGVCHLNSIDIIVLYPKGRCTRIQELQMITAVSENVHCFEVEGTSDDADTAIMKCFEDEDFVKAHNLISVNSFNIVRILIQTAHFFYLYLQLCSKVDETLEFVVPVGGCGHVTAALLASKMGLPIKIVTTCNANDTVYRTINQGIYAPSNDVALTLASAMDIQVPYNMERILYYLADASSSAVKRWMDEFGRNRCLNLPKDMVCKLQATFKAFRADDATIIATTKRCWKENQYRICPHTATALAYHYSDNRSTDSARVILATASPAKFPESLTAAGVPLSECPALDVLYQKETRFGVMTTSDDWSKILKEMIAKISEISMGS